MGRGVRRASLLVAIAVAAAACGGGGGSKTSTDAGSSSTTAPSAERSVEVSPLFYRDLGGGRAEGGTNPVTVRLRSLSQPTLRVGFTEDEVAGTGDQWRAAGWNAVTVATLLTGGPLTSREVTFDVNGAIDGPSAGGLLTVAVIALMRGDRLRDDVTMTGTINPDGTIGPVGGIPYKVDGVVQAKKRRMLIPAGQRNSADNSGKLVDIVELGRRKGIRVSEVRDIYEAYEAFTGKQLPRPDEGGSVELGETAYQRIKAKVGDWLSRYQSSRGEFASLPADLKQAFKSTILSAQTEATRAASLSKQGLQAGAYTHAVLAAALANAATKAGEATTVYVDQGVDAFLSRIRASTAISGRVQSLFDELKTFHPRTVADAAALVDTYSNAIDALSLSAYADDVLAGIARASDESEAATLAVEGALFHELAGTLVDSASDVYSIGRGLGGARLGGDLSLGQVADFFRKAAEANLNAFDTVVLGELAKQNQVSLEAVKTRFSANDLDYALSTASVGVLQGGLDDYLGDEQTAAYAKLGGAVSLYARSAGLVAKYYSLDAQFDDNLDVTGIGNEKALQGALELAKSQVERSVTLLQAKRVDPTLVVAGYESAGIDREGSASDKLDALASYWSSFVESRVLAYLGGFPDDGYR